MSGALTSLERTHDRAVPLLEARGLRIASRIGGSRRTIVSRIDLAVAPGETLGIVGESGSGKSLTARALIGLLPPGVFADGAVLYEGRNLLDLPERALARLRGAEIGLIFQDPFTMLNPLRRSGKHITEMLRDERGRQLSRVRQDEEAARRLSEVGIHEPSVADRYPFQLSGGMRQRVAIAAALARDPKILIADEPSTALDVTTQKEILALLKSLQELRGMGLVLITHDLRVAFSMCDRIHVLYAGSVLEVGRAASVETEPLHPYTLGLLLSEPRGDRRLSELVAIGGSVPHRTRLQPAVLLLRAAPGRRASAWPRKQSSPRLHPKGSLHASGSARSAPKCRRSARPPSEVRTSGLFRGRPNPSSRSTGFRRSSRRSRHEAKAKWSLPLPAFRSR